MDSVDFAKNLVKGKIAETIFAQMLRETKDFTVLEFGYEKIIPELVQEGCGLESLTVDTLRTAPDFAIINKKTKRVKLVEVKYQKSLWSEKVFEAATRMSQSWNPSYLFVATLDGFFFDEIEHIIKNKGAIPRLKHPQIKSEVQARYLKILTDFEKNN